MKLTTKLFASVILFLGMIGSSFSTAIALDACTGGISSNGPFRQPCDHNGETWYECLYEGGAIRDEARFGTTNYICPDENGSYEWAVDVDLFAPMGTCEVRYNLDTRPHLCPDECPATYGTLNGQSIICCGNLLANGSCVAPTQPPAGGVDDGETIDEEVNEKESSERIDARRGPTNETFDLLNPLKIGSSGDSAQRQLSTPAGIINRALRYLFPLAGLILFLMLIWGGFEVLSTAATKKSMDAGRQRAQAAIIGFILLFASYWIIQVIQAVFSISIL